MLLWRRNIKVNHFSYSKGFSSSVLNKSQMIIANFDIIELKIFNITEFCVAEKLSL